MDEQLHSRLIELKMEHADLDAMIDRLALETPLDELAMRRLKKRRLLLRDRIEQVSRICDPREPA
jgi:hypothetical protein